MVNLPCYFGLSLNISASHILVSLLIEMNTLKHFSVIMCKCPNCKKKLCQTFCDHRFCWSCLTRFTLAFKKTRIPKVDVIKDEVKADYKEQYQFERERLK